MSQGKEENGEQETEDFCSYAGEGREDHSSSDEGLGSDLAFRPHMPGPQRMRIFEGRLGVSSDAEPQDADYYFPQLSAELEVLILARVPRSEHWKLCFLNKHILNVLRSGELFKMRRMIGFEEPSVFMLPVGDKRWWAFDRQFTSWKKLPELPADDCFALGDKESLCAGSHLIVSGREYGGTVLWRFELETSKWFRGPSMINPRCLFASASCGTLAFVAGGVTMEMESGPKILNSAEKYNPETKSWHPLRRMHVKRKLCSGCYMDNKFYVIGGINEEGEYLTCGEAYDKDKNRWEFIPDMLEAIPVATSRSPPLVAVVNNQLYSLETSSNELKVYLKVTNRWKRLGVAPVRADLNQGWGVAFKALGDELLVIGASSSPSGDGLTICTCCPKTEADRELQWRQIDCCLNNLNHFILNCSVMVA